MGLIVIQPGVFATIQDRGRTGYRGFGVPVGGAFDVGSADLANALLGNPAEAAVVELTLVGGTYQALGPLALAIAGAPMSATVRACDGRERLLTIPVCFSLSGGDRLILGGTARGARAYLATRGGWNTGLVLGSRSNERAFAPGIELACEPGWTPVRRPDSLVNSFATVQEAPIRVIDGPDAALVADDWLHGGRAYRVGAECNRIGIRLEGPRCETVFDPDRVSSPVAPGAVQIAGGTPLVLGVACGTMGGYPHIGHVISADLDRLAQARPGDTVSFVRVSLREARRLDHAYRRERAERRAFLATAAADETAGAARDGRD